MADAQRPSGKRIQIGKANATMVIVVGIASFVTMFSLVAAKALWDQRSFQARVITEKELARDQLQANLAAVDSLQNSYQAFVGTSENVIGGNPSGKGDRDGDNAKIVLDALPSKYDFPALATSLEKILSDGGFEIDSITGTDDEVNQNANIAAQNTPIEIPFQISVSGSYGEIQKLVASMERSIRPLTITKISFSGDEADLQTQVDAKTYYLPEKTLQINTKEVK
jgi:hypothetical protein